MPKGRLSYDSKEACIMDAKRKGVSTAACNNLPGKKNPGNKNAASVRKPSGANPNRKGPTGSIMPPDPYFP